MERLPEEIRILYDNLIQSPGVENRLESREKVNLGEYDELIGVNNHDEPIYESVIRQEPYIKIDEHGNTASLAFIRSGEEPYTFNNLLAGFLCWASTNNKERVKLLDNALFANGDCEYNALLYRAFQGKLGLYASRGWLPEGGEAVLQEYKDTIYNYTKGQATNLIVLLNNLMISPELKAQMESLAEGDDKRFGTWLLSLDCNVYREAFIHLVTLARKKIENEIQVPEGPTARFLEAIAHYHRLNGSLYKEPACPVPAGEGGGRRSARKTQRRKLKRRVSRKGRRYSRRPHKARR